MDPSSVSSPCDTQWYLSQIKGSLEDENVDGKKHFFNVVDCVT